MVQRITDKVTDAITKAAQALSVYTRATQGLPITMVSAVAVPINQTQSVTITATVDCWVNAVSTNQVVTATAALSFTSLVTRIQIAGFTIFENQNTAVTPLMFDVTGGRAGYETPRNYHGVSTPFVMRQGDVMTVSFQNGAAAAITGTVEVDAYRCTHLTSG